MTKSLLNAITLFTMLMFCVSISHAARYTPDYACIITWAGTGQVDVHGLDWEGHFDPIPINSFDIRDDAPEFSYPTRRAIVISPKGNYFSTRDMEWQYGALYGIDANLNFHFLQALTGGCGGGGFSTDEAFFFTLTNELERTSEGPQMLTYSLAGDRCTLLNSESFPTTGGLTSVYASNDRDEVFGSGQNGALNSGFGGVICQFDRNATTPTLMIKQYFPPEEVAFYCSDISADGEFVVFSWIGMIGSLARQPDGTWEKTSQYWPDDLPSGLPSDAIFLTPDEQYVVAEITENDIGGIYVFQVTEDKRLEFHNYTYLDDPYAMGMSPDGKFLVVAYREPYSEKHLGIFSLSPWGWVNEVETWTHGNWVKDIKFLPQVLPANGAGDEWDLYSDAMPDPKPLELKSGSKFSRVVQPTAIAAVDGP